MDNLDLDRQFLRKRKKRQKSRGAQVVPLFMVGIRQVSVPGLSNSFCSTLTMNTSGTLQQKNSPLSQTTTLAWCLELFAERNPAAARWKHPITAMPSWVKGAVETKPLLRIGSLCLVARSGVLLSNQVYSHVWITAEKSSLWCQTQAMRICANYYYIGLRIYVQECPGRGSYICTKWV